MGLLSSLFRRAVEKEMRKLGFCKLGFRRMMSSTAINVNSGPSPLLMLPAESGKMEMIFKLHSLKTKSISEKSDHPLPEKENLELAGSSHGWLAVHNLVKNDFFLLNPTSGLRINLPSVDGGVSRVALSSSPSPKEDNEEEEEECRAMIISGCGRLAFCVPGRSTEWTAVGLHETDYEDVVYSSVYKRFFCMPANYLISCSSGLEVWDIREPLTPKISKRIDYKEAYYPWPCRSRYDAKLKEECWRIKYLLVYGLDLFVVVRHVNPRLGQDGTLVEPIYISKYRGWELGHPYKTFDFDVYKVDWLNRGDIMYMKGSLEGLSMFVGTSQSFALWASSSDSELKPDSIYFSDERSLMRKSRSSFQNEFGGHDNGIYDYRTNTFSSCCHHRACPLNPVDYDDIKRIEYDDIKRIEAPPLWFTPSSSVVVAGITA